MSINIGSSLTSIFSHSWSKTDVHALFYQILDLLSEVLGFFLVVSFHPPFLLHIIHINSDFCDQREEVISFALLQISRKLGWLKFGYIEVDQEQLYC